MGIQVKLPDGGKRELTEGSSILELAADISKQLAKKAVLGVVNDEPVDLSYPLQDNDQVQIITKDDALGLETLRHSAAHLMAAALLKIFPSAQLTIGPVVEDGFYYDIYLPEGENPIREEDFPRIEAEMARLVQANDPFVRCVADTENDAVFQDYKIIDGGHNPFKQEIVEGLKQEGAFSGQQGAPEVSFYRNGDFIDLCRGPHVPSTGWLKHTKLMKVAGSYWRADSSKQQLIRLYGTAFFSKKELDEYLHRLEEAKKRDHRILGEQLDLFHFEQEGPGFPFFHPKGTIIYNCLQDFMRAQLARRSYQEVRTPLILSESFWHTSGHYQNYLENMFFTKRKERDDNTLDGVDEDAHEDRPMAVKPMNCPGHVLIYGRGLRSYNELPLRLAEMGIVHRRELSGVRHGLFRVQAFAQDDAHHFCTPEGIEAEISMLVEFFFEIYQAFDLKDVQLELSTRPEKSIGSDEVWERAESALKNALEQTGHAFTINPGDGAFYGPKIDFHIRDAIQRSWQCGTIQLDFSMPERFGLEYVGSDGKRHTPVMIHRACYGSLERFFGIITEHYAGAFPLWLAPVQVSILPISDKFTNYAQKVEQKLLDQGLRVSLDLRNERLGHKIRDGQLQKIPYLLILGQKEEESETVNVRSRDQGELGALCLDDFLEQLEPIGIQDKIRQTRCEKKE